MRISDWSSDVCSSDLVLAVRPTDCNDTPVPVAIFRFATHGGTADPLVKGNGRLLAAANFLFADDAELVALGCVNAVQTDARPMDFYGIAVDHRGLANNRNRTRRAAIPRLGCYHRRSEEHTSELQSLMRISYAVFCLKKKKKYTQDT